MATTTLRQTDIERMIYACRMRQLKAQYFGNVRDAQLAEMAVNRWLDLWRPCVIDRAIRI